MKKMICIPFFLLFVGCVSMPNTAMPDTDRIMAQSNLMQQLMKEPDLPQWYNYRQQITQSLGDRVFDKSFSRVFDSLTVALASMGMTVDNMERESGYIVAHGYILPPDQSQELRSEELKEWCSVKGYDPSLLEQRNQYEVDPDFASGMMQQGTTLTISLVKQSESQTKVKLRFNGVYYPRKLEEYYKAVWPKLDKQIFLDKETD
jgi:hypothetical protein